MTKPLLHLLHHETLDPAARVALIEELLHRCPALLPTDEADGRWIRRIMIATSIEAREQLDALASALTRYPHLNLLQFHIHGALLTELPSAPDHARPAPSHRFTFSQQAFAAGLAEADLLVDMQPHAQSVLPVLEAMAEGVPVLVSDGSDVKFVRDGINGFLYRAHDADSLALSLLTLRSLSSDIVQRIVGQARETLSGLINPHHLGAASAKGDT